MLFSRAFSSYDMSILTENSGVAEKYFELYKDDTTDLEYFDKFLSDCGDKILVDKETGVNYIFYQSGYAGGLTPLLDSHGNVVVTPIIEE